MKTDMKCKYRIINITLLHGIQYFCYGLPCHPSFPIDILHTIHTINYREYQLSVRQQPKQSRMCGIGEKGMWLP